MIAGFGVGLSHTGGIKGCPCRLDDDLERQIVFFGKFEIALIVGRNRHDSTGAVVHQNKIGQKDRHAGPCQRIDAVRTGKDPLLLKIIGGTFDPVGLF